MTAQPFAAYNALPLNGHEWKVIPMMFLAIPTSILLLILLNTRLTHRMARATPTPGSLAAAAALFLCEWLLGVQVRSMSTDMRSFLYRLQPVGVRATILRLSHRRTSTIAPRAAERPGSGTQARQMGLHLG
jgi:hypothetical protein